MRFLRLFAANQFSSIWSNRKTTQRLPRHPHHRFIGVRVRHLWVGPFTPDIPPASGNSPKPLPETVTIRGRTWPDLNDGLLARPGPAACIVR